MAVENKNDVNRYTIKRIPPEGGWGYLIGIGMALPFVSINASIWRLKTKTHIE